MDVTPMIRVDGYAMLYTGLVLLASLATCTFAYPWLEGLQGQQRRVLPAGADRRAGRHSAGRCGIIWRRCSSVSN
ncbi:hypothetical protein LNP25_30830 [Klebsiella variicola subsp. variicola]|nr:hypothetical protein [Klebsiella variicola subsp. variicola]